MRKAHRSSAVTFVQLVDRLESVGLVVGLEHDGDTHAITVVDLDSSRAIRLPVTRDFDNAASRLVLSARLRETLGITAPSHSGQGASMTVVCGRWPEFFSLWPELGRPATAA